MKSGKFEVTSFFIKPDAGLMISGQSWFNGQAKLSVSDPRYTDGRALEIKLNLEELKELIKNLEAIRDQLTGRILGE